MEGRRAMKWLTTGLLLASLAGTLGLFLYTGEPTIRDRKPLPAPIEQIYCLTPGNVFLSIAGTTGECAVWNMRTCDKIAILQGFPRAIVSLVQSPDERRLYAYAEPPTLLGWEIATGKECFRVELTPDKSPVGGKLFPVPGGKELIVADSGRLVRINLAAKETPTYLDLDFLTVEPDLENDGQTPDRTGPPPHCAFFFDSANSFKCVIRFNDRLEVWDIFSKKKERTFPDLDSSSGAQCFTVTSNGQVLVTCDIQSRLRAWSIADGEERDSHTVPLAVQSLVASPGGRFVVAHCFDDVALARGLRSVNKEWAYELGARLPDAAESVLLDLQTGVISPGFPFTVVPREKWNERRSQQGYPLVGFLQNDGLLVMFTEKGVLYWDLPPSMHNLTPWAWAALAATLGIFWIRLRIGKRRVVKKEPGPRECGL
jgi:hypothetical protein